MSISLPGWAESLDDILGGFEQEETRGEGSEKLQDSLDHVFSGFEQDKGPLAGASRQAGRFGKLDLNSSMALAGSYNAGHKDPEPGSTDHRGLSRLKLSVDVNGDYSFTEAWRARVGLKGFYDLAYDLRGREEFTSQVLDEYVQELEIGEMWLAGTLTPSLDLKIGRQIVVWGKSDNIRVTDILNPLDGREPGLVDIRDLRLPVVMTKMDYYWGSWSTSALLIHETRFNKEPVFGNDFYGGSAPAVPHDKPSTSLQNQEYALAVNGVFRGWDIAFYGAQVFDDYSHQEQTDQGARRCHSRLAMAGTAMNFVWGNFLLKSEAAYLHGLEYSTDVGKKSRLDFLLGTEYTGLGETVLAVEVVDRHIFAFDDHLKLAPVYGREDDIQLVFKASRDFINDRLTVTGLVSIFDLSGAGGSFARFTSAYDLMDGVTVSGGFILYQSGDRPAFRNIGDNDRLFAEVRYFF